MARPQMESGVEQRSRGRQQSCRMEVQRPDAWPGGSVHPHRITYPTYQQCPNGNSQPSPDRAPLPPSAQAQDTPIRESTDPECEHQDNADREPLPDLLPQRERSPQASPQPRAPGRGDPWLDDEVTSRVAHQLRSIGDDLNAVILQRLDAIPQQQDWRVLCLGVLNFLSDTLSALYRLV